MNHDELVEMRLSELLADRPAEVSELALHIRKEVAKASREASELLYKTYAVANVFTFSKRSKEAFIHIATYAEHVNLGFNYGVQLPDPDGLLEGTGKLIRHIRIESRSAMRKKPIKNLVKAAIEHGREMAEKAGGVQARQFYDKAS